MSRRNFSNEIEKNACCNCGSTENLMFHHIVPMSIGGNDVRTNICVLCEECHGKVHNTKLFAKKGYKHGRKISEYTDTDVETMQLWCDKKIGTAECKDRLGKTHGFRITSSGIFKDMLRKGLIQWDGRRNGMDISTAKSERVEVRRY